MKDIHLIGAAVLLLIAIYGVSVIFEKQANDQLLEVIGTALGLLLGRASKE